MECVTCKYYKEPGLCFCPFDCTEQNEYIPKGYGKEVKEDGKPE